MQRFAYFLPYAHIFKLTKHSILNTIRSDMDLNRVCKCRERDIKVNIPSADRQVDRERERERKRDACVLFEFRQIFYSGNSSTYFKVCVDLCKKSDRTRCLAVVVIPR